MNVLVSGVGGDIGLGIARVLKEWGIFSNLHGIDIHADHPGMAVLDAFSIAPRAMEANYISWLRNYVYENEIELFFPTSEAEIQVLSLAKIQSIAGAKVIRNNDFTVKKCLDKFECLSYLNLCGVPVPEHGLVGLNLPQNYPVIVKPRYGQGSKNVKMVSTLEDYLKCTEGYVWQDYLEPEEEEYTCAIYSLDAISFKSLLLKRKLVGGLSGSGVVVNNPEIKKYIQEIAKKIQLCGSINIQLRLTKSGPLLFEINPRISSTVVFRDKMGFCDARWWIQDILGLDKEPYHEPEAGTRFYRGACEYIIP